MRNSALLAHFPSGFKSCDVVVHLPAASHYNQGPGDGFVEIRPGVRKTSFRSVPRESGKWKPRPVPLC